ncbi:MULTISPECIES: hypothetical protein [unclassified Moorena]|uniref:hypothetical protein n=1 Tax=unclassified Moorena TaxID=2683338 RepID=UPI001400533A|nr:MULTISPECIES: hypothetical protein [unclassified Moorena]NEO16960.1 hypothetical protein [Moorena sp. SIO3E8]NEQ03560.1 hypothetical protein [Moorena sp. SIO3F7]
MLTLNLVDLLQKYFPDTVCVNSCPLFPVPCSLFPTTAAKSSFHSTPWHQLTPD